MYRRQLTRNEDQLFNIGQFQAYLHGRLGHLGRNISALIDRLRAGLHTLLSRTNNEDVKLLASDAAANGAFGVGMSISGDTVVAGAYQDDDNGLNSGSAYVFVKPAGGWSGGTLNEAAKLLASDGAAGDSAGFSVSISGDTVVVSAHGDDDKGDRSGSAYVFSLAVNEPPTAVAGPDQMIRVLGDTIILDGSASFDDNTASAALGYPLKSALGHERTSSAAAWMSV